MPSRRFRGEAGAAECRSLGAGGLSARGALVSDEEVGLHLRVLGEEAGRRDCLPDEEIDCRGPAAEAEVGPRLRVLGVEEAYPRCPFSDVEVAVGGFRVRWDPPFFEGSEHFSCAPQIGHHGRRPGMEADVVLDRWGCRSRSRAAALAKGSDRAGVGPMPLSRRRVPGGR